MVKINLNTHYHREEDIKKAEEFINEYRKDITSQDEANAYASLLIFSKFDTDKADKFYDKLCKDGVLYYSEFLGYESSSVVGWVLDI